MSSRNNRLMNQVGYSSKEHSKVRMMIHLHDLNLTVNIGGVREKDIGVFIYEPGFNDKLHVRVEKIDLEFGNRLISSNYYFRNSDELDSTNVIEITECLVELINDGTGLSNMPKRQIKSNKTRQEELVNIEIRREVRALKIDSIV